jgi:hypothetical protein
MILHVYAICWNEEKLLPFFIRHYSAIAEKIVIYDNESSDRSRIIIESSPKCEYKSYASDNQIRDDYYANIKNNAWKESRGKADLVIVVDIDEFVYCPTELIKELKRLKRLGLSIIIPTGYNMISENIPWDTSQNLTELCKTGAYWKAESKPCIFDLNAIKEINYTFGGHHCRPKSLWQKLKNRFLVRIVKNNILLLHYKYLGLDYTVNRYRLLRDRLSEYNNSVSAGEHYARTDQDFINEFENLLVIAKPVID